MVKTEERNSCEKYKELIDSLKVGELYRYIGNGEFEIFDVTEFVKEALNKSMEKLP